MATGKRPRTLLHMGVPALGACGIVAAACYGVASTICRGGKIEGPIDFYRRCGVGFARVGGLLKASRELLYTNTGKDLAL